MQNLIKNNEGNKICNTNNVCIWNIGICSYLNKPLSKYTFQPNMHMPKFPSLDDQTSFLHLSIQLLAYFNSRHFD